MADKFGRRSFLAAGVAAAGALAVVSGEALPPGAAGASTTPSTNGPGRNGVTTATPKRGGTLTFGTDSEESGFSPIFDLWDGNGYLYGATVFDPLVAVTATGEPVPYLAKSVVPANDDYTSWFINMRPGIKFHNGTPCDAKAIYTTMHAAQTSPATGVVFAEFISKATVTSPLQLRVDLKTPLVTFPYYLASQVGYVAAPSMLATKTGMQHPVGTGPFVITSWVPNTHFTATRNPNYWRKGFPYLDSITYKPILDDTSRSQALRLGAVDLIETGTPEIIVQYRGNRTWSYVDNSGGVAGEPTVSCIQLNCDVPPFNDHNARLAMAKAYTQAEICRIFGQGVTEPVNGPFPKGSPYYSDTGYPGYDPAGARAAVKAFEKKHGKKLAFSLNYPPVPTVSRLVTYLRQRYVDAGMKITLSVVEPNLLIEKAVLGDYQAVTWQGFGVVSPTLNYVWWSDKTINKTGISLNIARNKDPRIQAALVAGQTATTAAQRQKAFQSIGKYLAEDLPYTWLGTAVRALIANPKVQDFANPVAPNGTKLTGRGLCWPTQLWVT